MRRDLYAVLQKGTRLALTFAVLGGIFFGYSNCGELTAEDLQSLDLDSSNGGSGSGSGDNPFGGGSATPGTAAGADYFAKTVNPAFQNACRTCHQDPRFGGNAPLSVYNYDRMLAGLRSGGRPVDNALYNKILNILAHDGGNLCPSGMNTGVCALVIEWWKLESNNQNPSMVAGRILDVGLLGEVIGWAGDIGNSGRSVSIRVYANGDNQTGTEIADMVANQNAPINDGVPGNHRFRFTLGEAYRNGVEQSLTVYAVEGGQEILLSSVPYKFTAFTQKAAGRTFFTNTLAGAMNSCNGCHTVSYDAFYYSLAAPIPKKTGTATNNELINNANGENHAGGSFCGGNKNGGLCANLQQWWNIEFGP